MKFLQISEETTLSELSERIGSRNISNLLTVNSVERTYNIGKAYQDMCNQISENNPEVDWQRKATILNSLSANSDVFEYASLLGDKSWKVLSSIGSFPGMLKLPDTINVADSTDILGNGQAVPKTIYQSVMNQLQVEPHTIDPSSFNEISCIKHSSILAKRGYSLNIRDNNVFEMFNIPWGQISLYSSIAKESVDIPVYPEEVEDDTIATYTQMPDLLYQYEPWQVYQSSGPRTCTYEFHMHRDMWTGDHRDGKCNELVRFCQAQCYAEYKGASVNTPIVTLYVSGSALITGIVTNVKPSWKGPIGLDGWYLECTLSITITEISNKALSFSEVRNKPLIG